MWKSSIILILFAFHLCYEKWLRPWHHIDLSWIAFWSNRDPDEDAVQDGGADTEVETKGKKKTKKKKHSE